MLMYIDQLMRQEIKQMINKIIIIILMGPPLETMMMMKVAHLVIQTLLTDLTMTAHLKTYYVRLIVLLREPERCLRNNLHLSSA